MLKVHTLNMEEAGPGFDSASPDNKISQKRKKLRLEIRHQGEHESRYENGDVVRKEY
jgi:hypothetical protein